MYTELTKLHCVVISGSGEWSKLLLWWPASLTSWLSIPGLWGTVAVKALRSLETVNHAELMWLACERRRERRLL